MDPTTQVLLTVTIPTVTVLVGILVGNARITDANSRLSDLREHMDSRFDMMQKYLDARFSEANAQLRRVEKLWMLG